MLRSALSSGEQVTQQWNAGPLLVSVVMADAFLWHVKKVFEEEVV